MYGTMAALKRMRPRNRGTIVQVGSAQLSGGAAAIALLRGEIRDPRVHAEPALGTDP